MVVLKYEIQKKLEEKIRNFQPWNLVNLPVIGFRRQKLGFFQNWFKGISEGKNMWNFSIMRFKGNFVGKICHVFSNLRFGRIVENKCGVFQAWDSGGFHGDESVGFSSMRFRWISEQEMWVFKVEIQWNFRGKNKDEVRTFPTLSGACFCRKLEWLTFAISFEFEVFCWYLKDHFLLSTDFLSAKFVILERERVCHRNFYHLDAFNATTFVNVGLMVSWGTSFNLFSCKLWDAHPSIISRLFVQTKKS